MEPSQGDSDTVVVEENDSMTLTIPVHEVTSSDVVFEHRSSRLLVQYAGNRRKRYQDLLGGQGQHFLADVARQLGESRGEDEEGGEQLVVVDEEGSLSRHHPVTEEEKSSIVARAASRMAQSMIETIHGRDRGRFLERVAPGNDVAFRIVPRGQVIARLMETFEHGIGQFASSQLGKRPGNSTGAATSAFAAVAPAARSPGPATSEKSTSTTNAARPDLHKAARGGPPARKAGAAQTTKLSASDLAQAIPENASCVFYVYDRRVNLDVAVGTAATTACATSASCASADHHADPTMYSLLRAWVQDDPHRKVLVGDLQDYETVQVPVYRSLPPSPQRRAAVLPATTSAGSAQQQCAPVAAETAPGSSQHHQSSSSSKDGSCPAVWESLQKQWRSRQGEGANVGGVSGGGRGGAAAGQNLQVLAATPWITRPTPHHHPPGGGSNMPPIGDLTRERTVRYKAHRRARKKALRARDRHVLKAMEERGVKLL